MAIYVFKMKTFTRNAGSRGSRATSAAAYRAGERIRDARTGASYDHRYRHDVLHKEIVLPRELAARGPQMDWARDRATLWNAAERAETRTNSRVAREFTLALPHELGPAERVRLSQRFAHDLAERYRNAVDLVIHAPRGDARNYHAHLLTTTREVTLEGLGRKAALELSGTERHRRGLARWDEERAWLREYWAEASNQALREAGLDVRISHLPPTTPDLTRPPRLPLAAYHMERAGRRSFIAERIRVQHRTQLEHAPHRTWLERTRGRAQAAWVTLRDRLGIAKAFDQGHPTPPVRRAAVPVRSAEHQPGREPPVAERATAASRDTPVSEHSAARDYTATHDYTGSYPDEAQFQAVRDWQEYRQQAAAHAAGSAQPDTQHARSAGTRGSAEPELPSGRGNDHDLSL